MRWFRLISVCLLPWVLLWTAEFVIGQTRSVEPTSSSDYSAAASEGSKNGYYDEKESGSSQTPSDVKPEKHPAGGDESGKELALPPRLPDMNLDAWRPKKRNHFTLAVPERPKQWFSLRSLQGDRSRKEQRSQQKQHGQLQEPPLLTPKESRTTPRYVWPGVPNQRTRAIHTTGHRAGHTPKFGSVVGLERTFSQEKPSRDVLRGSGIFNYKYGYINPYYPFPVDTPLIRPAGDDYHEGWVSKYLYSRPTVSPYLELFRHDISPSGSNLYNTLVRPQLAQAYGSVQSQPMPKPPQFHGSPSMSRVGRSTRSEAPTTGHPSHFMRQVSDLNMLTGR